MPLTNVTCQKAKPDVFSYKLSDSGGLFLQVMPNGSRYWRLKYRFLGKEKLLAIALIRRNAEAPVPRSRTFFRWGG